MCIIFYIIVYEVIMMRTNININANLMKEAMRMALTKTKKETVEIALNELIENRKRKQILNYRGKLNWTGDLDEMRKTM